jgi:serine/threonine protein phosphatase PrpC
MGFRIDSAGFTDTGTQRTQNEDSILLLPEMGIFVICDGMGGHASGAVASQMAVATIAECLHTGQPAVPPGEDPLVIAIIAANQKIYAAAQLDPTHHQMGTTVVAVRQEADILHLCHVGDSRVYMLRNGDLSQVTRDHSLVNLYADKPELAGKYGAAHSNIIVRAVGLHEYVEVEHRVLAMEPGDIFMLCSDGLVDMVDDWMVREMMTSGEDLGTTAQNLIRAANAHGGADNVSVILLRCSEVGVQQSADAVPSGMYPVAG